MNKLSKEQERVLILMLNPENKSAYDCKSTMNTMYALVHKDLIKRTNYKDIVWYGWENVSMEFVLTIEGRALAEKLKEVTLTKTNKYHNPFVNRVQTKEERRWKYRMLRDLGLTVGEARSMRDYNFSTILRHFEVEVGDINGR